MEAPSSDKLGKRVRRAFVSFLAACWLMGATFAGIFLYDQVGREPFGTWWDPLIMILFAPLVVPLMVFWFAADWVIGTRPGEQPVRWPVPVFAIIWAGCFMLIGRLMGPRGSA